MPQSFKIGIDHTEPLASVEINPEYLPRQGRDAQSNKEEGSPKNIFEFPHIGEKSIMEFTKVPLPASNEKKSKENTRKINFVRTTFEAELQVRIIAIHFFLFCLDAVYDE